MEITYSELGRTIAVEVEPGDGLAIYSKSITRWDPHEVGELLSKEDKEKIIKNICDSLEFMGIGYVLV